MANIDGNNTISAPYSDVVPPAGANWIMLTSQTLDLSSLTGTILLAQPMA